MPNTLSIADFRDACQGKRGCPFCVIRAKETARYFRFFLGEYVNDGDTNMHLWRSLGFCHAHAWQVRNQEWTGEKDGLGVAIVYERVLQAWQERLASIAGFLEDGEAAGLGGIAHRMLHPKETAEQALTPHERCPACLHAENSEKFVFTETADLLEADPRGDSWAWLTESKGVCLPHFRKWLPFFHDHAAIRNLCRLQETRIAALRSQLDEYVRKHDYRFHHEGYSDLERSSGSDAVSLMVGDEESGPGEG